MTTEVVNEQKIQVPFVDFKRRFSLLSDEITKETNAVFASGSYILGDYVEEFERIVAAYLGCQYVIAVANGTDAIILALKVLNIGINDEVIVPVNSFVASAGAVVAVGATPVFCDVTEDLNIDVAQLEKCITKKTKAILPVHLTGRSANMDAVLQIANRYSLAVIEDAAQSIGATFKGKMTGTMGNMGCFSLHPLKNLHVYGDGGLITTNDEAVHKKLKLLRNHGLIDRDTCVSWGLNSRLDSVQAKIGSIGMRHLDQWTARRRQIAKLYRKSLHNLVKVPEETEEYYSVYHNFVTLTDRRNELMSFLKEQNIETKIHYPVPLHLQPAAVGLGYQRGDFPVAERLAQHMLSLPVYPELLDEEINRVIHAIQSFFKVQR